MAGVTVATAGRKAQPVLATAISVVAIYGGGLTIYLTALLVWGDAHDGVWLKAILRGGWLFAVPASCIATFRFIGARRQRRSEAIIAAALISLLVALPLLAWGILTISDFSGID